MGFILLHWKRIWFSKPNDIVFVCSKVFTIKKGSHPKWRFHQDICTKEAKAIVHGHSTGATQFRLIKRVSAFHYMVAVAGGEDINAVNTQLWN